MTRLFARIVLGLLALAFVFLLIDADDGGSWTLAAILVWLLAAVAAILSLASGRFIRRRRSRRGFRAIRTIRLRSSSSPAPPPARPLYLSDRRD